MSRVDYFRFQVDETDDRGGQQGLKGKGFRGEELTGVMRQQPYGLSSHVPKGSTGYAVALGGDRDRVLSLGVEHEGKRTKNLPEGAVALYGPDGQVLKYVGKDINFVGGKATFKFTSFAVEADTILMKGQVDLGDTGGLAVDRTDNNPSIKVKAV